MTRSLPGAYAGRSMTPRDPLFSHEALITVPIVVDGQMGIDGGNGDYSYEIRPGWLMGRIAASGRWTPCKRTRVVGATESSSAGGDATTFEVDNAAPFKVGDAVTVGNDTGLMITAVDYELNEITVNDPIDVADDDDVAATDGSQTCRGVLLDFVRLRDPDNVAAAHQPASLLIFGAIRTALVLGDVDAVRADTGAKLAGILFSDDYGV